MANIKSKKKSIRLMDDRRVRNMSIRSRMKTMVRAAETAIEEKDEANIKTAVTAAISSVDRAAAKGLIHKNNAARKKSQLVRQSS